MIIASLLALTVLSAQGQGIDLAAQRDPAVEDYDFAWVHWFETHGREYLREPLAEDPLPWDTPASRRWRGEVAEALAGLLDDADPSVRAAAVIALARVDGESAVEALVRADRGDPPSALFDESPAVRSAGLVALGLIDLPLTRVLLAAEPPESASAEVRAAHAAAIGLLSEIQRDHQLWLVTRLQDADESLEVKRWCLWALRQHDDEQLDRAFDAALAELPSPFIIAEVLQHVGYLQRRGGASWLVNVLRYDPDVRQWAGYRALSGLPAQGVFGSTPRRLGMETRVAVSLTIARLPLLREEDEQRRLLGMLHRRMTAGNSPQVMDFNRGPDTIAYFMHCNLEPADVDLLYDQLRGFTVLPPDDPAVLEELEEGQAPTPADLIQRQSDNELRGYAAIATGLLMRRATEGTQLFAERPLIGRAAIDIERLKRRFGIRLMRAVADPEEPVSYRAACALALGLSADPRYREELAGELARLRRGDEAVLGYGLLALAMLGEERVTDPAVRYLTRPGLVTGSDDLLGRRATLRAIGLIGQRGGEEVSEALVGAWGRDPWVSLAVAEATAMTGRYDAVPAMLEALASESPTWRRTAAQALGAVFDRSFPSRLAPLIEQTNPTMSLRPVESEEEARDVGPVIVEEPEDDGPDVSAWPMRLLPALADPFVIELMRGEAD